MAEVERGLSESSRVEAEELPNYRPVSVPAMVGLLLGLASPLAVLHPVVWFVPALAVVVNAYALLSIDRSGPVIGRSAAAWGLALALLFGTLAPARVYSYDYFQKQDARRFAGAWFEFLRRGEPHKAYQLTLAPTERTLDDEHLTTAYRDIPALREGLKRYVETPLVRTLLALGERAEVRRYDTEKAATDKRNDLVEEVYAVTYEEDGQTKSFFIKLTLVRNLKDLQGPPRWHLQSAEGGYRPQSWKAS